jgi:hypothetical protein
MTTKMSKAATLAAVAATLMAVTLAYSVFVVPASAQAQPPASASSSSSNNSASNSVTPSVSSIQIPASGPEGQRGFRGPPIGAYGGAAQGQQVSTMSVGQTFTITSTQGKYFAVGNRNENGTASGALTFTVTGKLTAGYTLSLTSGSIVVNGTTYTVSSGSAQMGPGAAELVGQGATTPTGQFLVRATAHGSFAGTTATASLDFSNGTTEYLVLLAGTA